MCEVTQTFWLKILNMTELLSLFHSQNIGVNQLSFASIPACPFFFHLKNDLKYFIAMNCSFYLSKK